MKKQALLIVIVGMTLISPLQAFAFNLGIAGEFNAFILGDFRSNSDTEGRLAVGGNVNLQGYSVGDRLSDDEKAAHPDTLVVGGNLDFTNGTVYGNAVVRGNANLNSVDVQGELKERQGSIDFDSEAVSLRNKSLELSLLEANGTLNSQYGGLYLSGDGTSDMQVFEIHGEDLLSAHTLELKDIADDATVILNVSGDYSGFSNMGMNTLANFSDNVLFNFFDAEELLINGVGVEGSILAPFARVSANNGQLEGTMVAASVDGSMEYHHNPFTGGALPLPAPIPEPSTFLLLAAGVIGLFSVKSCLKRWV